MERFHFGRRSTRMTKFAQKLKKKSGWMCSRSNKKGVKLLITYANFNFIKKSCLLLTANRNQFDPNLYNCATLSAMKDEKCNNLRALELQFRTVGFSFVKSGRLSILWLLPRGAMGVTLVFRDHFSLLNWVVKSDSWI